MSKVTKPEKIYSDLEQRGMILYLNRGKESPSTNDELVNDFFIYFLAIILFDKDRQNIPFYRESH